MPIEAEQLLRQFLPRPFWQLMNAQCLSQSWRIVLVLIESYKFRGKWPRMFIIHQLCPIDLTYQYDPDNAKRARTYTAESIIAENGKGNTVPSVKNPELFCNATSFFIEGLLDEVFVAAKNY